jgi:hypothetical protein
VVRVVEVVAQVVGLLVLVDLVLRVKEIMVEMVTDQLDGMAVVVAPVVQVEMLHQAVLVQQDKAYQVL